MLAANKPAKSSDVSKKRLTCILVAAIGVAMVGCAATGDSERVERTTSALEELRAAQEERNRTPELPSIVEMSTFFADVTPQARERGQWLEEIPFEMSVDQHGGAVSLREVLRIFGGQGINIATQMDLSNYYYSGPSISGTNAREALRLILGSMGVDYRVNENNRSIEVITMPRETYYVSLNNREASYSSGSAREISEGDIEEVEDSTASLGITANNNFWDSLTQELESRCTILVPTYGDPVLMSGGDDRFQHTGGGGEDELLVSMLQGQAQSTVFQRGEKTVAEERICQFSINPNTGAIAVQGPAWVQDDLKAYFDNLNATLNTSITINAKILLVRQTHAKSEGVDLSLFAGSLENTGLAIRNNVLGGVTLASTGNRADVSAPGALGGSLLGGRIDGAQVFIGWLEEMGDVAIENEPVITTVSGVPTTFQRTSPVVYFRYSQQTTATDGGAVLVSIDSEEVERRVGSVININPTYDRQRRVVRAQLGINQRYLTAFAEDVSFLAVGDRIEEVPVRVPMIEEITLNGEVLLRDGETVIIGGQRFSTSGNTQGGVRNLRRNSVLGGLFGTSLTEDDEMTFYMVLTVSVDEGRNEQVPRL